VFSPLSFRCKVQQQCQAIGLSDRPAGFHILRIIEGKLFRVLARVQNLAQQLRSELFEKFTTRFLVGQNQKWTAAETGKDRSFACNDIKKMNHKGSIMNPLKKLLNQGQSIWLDYIQGGLVRRGELKRLVENDGVRGLTSNPTIFEKAIAGSNDYDDSLRAMLGKDPHCEPGKLLERLVIENIRAASDIFRNVYDETEGTDGFVSIEVSPRLAHDTAGTIDEAKRLRLEVDRPNVMIKVPATSEGIPAIEALIAEGVNVNITLMFSMKHYEAVARAYIRGLERCSNPRQVSSVASFFVSRVDTVVDSALKKLGTVEASTLLGKVAIANCKLVYRRFREIFYGEAFATLRGQRARVQRPLWASTGTKNPVYSDVLYVENLVGPDTVNTLPSATLNAFRSHGRVKGLTVGEGLEEAESDLHRLKELGVDLNAITEKLQGDGITAFTASFDHLLAAVEEKRKRFAARAEPPAPGVDASELPCAQTDEFGD
jgi:transaldolase